MNSFNRISGSHIKLIHLDFIVEDLVTWPNWAAKRMRNEVFYSGWQYDTQDQSSVIREENETSCWASHRSLCLTNPHTRQRTSPMPASPALTNHSTNIHPCFCSGFLLEVWCSGSLFLASSCPTVCLQSGDFNATQAPGGLYPDVPESHWFSAVCHLDRKPDFHV